MRNETLDVGPKWPLDALIAIPLFALTAGAWVNPAQLAPLQSGSATVFLALWLIGLGVVLLLGYFFPNGSHLLHGASWLSENLLWGRWLLMLWGVILVASGAVTLLIGLAVVRR